MPRPVRSVRNKTKKYSDLFDRGSVDGQIAPEIPAADDADRDFDLDLEDDDDANYGGTDHRISDGDADGHGDDDERDEVADGMHTGQNDGVTDAVTTTAQAGKRKMGVKKHETSRKKKETKEKKELKKSRLRNGSMGERMHAVFGPDCDPAAIQHTRETWGTVLAGPSEGLVLECYGSSPRLRGKRLQLEREAACRPVTREEVHLCVPPPSHRGKGLEAVLTADGKPLTIRTWETVDLASIGTRQRAGFLIHTGMHVRCIDWAPRTGTDQFLAVSGSLLGTPALPLYSFAPSPCCIQIWRVSDGRVSLHLVLAHEYGRAWNLAWAPVAYDQREEPSPDAATRPTDRPIGVLAGVFADGKVRVFSVGEQDQEQGTAGGTEPIVRAEPAIELAAPEAHAEMTCMAWISGTNVAIGHANGMVSVWDLAGTVRFPLSTFMAHGCLVQSITSCAPSFPNHLVTCAFDCETRIHDWTRPEREWATGMRQRTMNHVTGWSGAVQSALCGDDGSGVRGLPLRIPGTTFPLASHAATVWAAATSPLHPFLATAGCEGLLSVTNCLRRLMFNKAPHYRRTVFRLDYAQKQDTFRFVDNYNVEVIPSQEAGARSINPPQTGITAVSWNPNLDCAGWLASGMYCGFVRIDDLAID